MIGTYVSGVVFQRAAAVLAQHKIAHALLVRRGQHATNAIVHPAQRYDSTIIR